MSQGCHPPFFVPRKPFNIFHAVWLTRLSVKVLLADSSLHWVLAKDVTSARSTLNWAIETKLCKGDSTLQYNNCSQSYGWDRDTIWKRPPWVQTKPLIQEQPPPLIMTILELELEVVVPHQCCNLIMPLVLIAQYWLRILGIQRISRF